MICRSRIACPVCGAEAETEEIRDNFWAAHCYECGEDFYPDIDQQRQLFADKVEVADVER